MPAGNGLRLHAVDCGSEPGRSPCGREGNRAGVCSPFHHTLGEPVPFTRPTTRTVARLWARRFALAAIASGLAAVGVSLPARTAGAAPAPPSIAAAVHYLVTVTNANGVVGGTSLTKDGYYEAFDRFGDFGLTIDGAFALASTGTDNAILEKVVNFLDQGGKDQSGRSINDWTGIGTPFASGGSIGKEALLAEMTGRDPRHFGGHDLIAGLDGVICTTTDVANGCGGPGNYLFATSTFSQALGILAQLRAGDTADATGPIAYLESLQNSDGSWPSLIPSTGNADVDSTAMAAMALALLPNDPTASAAVTKAVTWIAPEQSAAGGFPGVAADSTNSTGLAIQALTLAGSTYAAQITKADAFLAGEQNTDGGFNVAVGGQQGSDVRASAQVVSGVVGTSFGTLTDAIAPGVPTTTTTTTSPTKSTTTTTTVVSAVAGATTTVAPISATAEPNTGARTLPNTGSDTRRPLEVAVALCGLGLGLAATLTRRRRGDAR